MACSDNLNEGEKITYTSRILSDAPITEDDRKLARGLMLAAQRTLATLIEKEANIYTIADLKVKFR
jgi:hypothetical protein